MTEDIEEVLGRPVSRETLATLEQYSALLRRASAEQNLVSASTLDKLWSRHILDSAQLVRHTPSGVSSWLDVGSGAGLPGLVVAMLVDGPVTLVEPRRLRVNFLSDAVNQLGLAARVSIEPSRVERISGQYDIITGRAVAALDRFLGLTRHLGHAGTIWVLPKGRQAQSELEQARQNWHCDARVEPSCTDAESGIIVLTRVRKRQ